jgi:hypothetical protein
VITENLDLFFADFGVSFVAGAVSGMCIKDQPGINILGDQVIQVDYQVIVKSSLFGGLLYNDYVTVDGLAFAVKETMPVEDGVFSLITLEKLMQAAFRLLLEDGFLLLLEDGSALLLE